MAVVKVNFGNQELEVVSVKDCNNQLWLLANPFARILQYANSRNAIAKFVSVNNQLQLHDLKAPRIEALASSIHPQSKFINRAGLFELIQGSKMPKAKEFRNWVNSDLLVKLSDTGEYCMQTDAPIAASEAMNVIHKVCNNGQEAPWQEELNEIKHIIQKKDDKIEELTVSLTEANGALISLSQNLSSALNMVNEARQDMTQLANRVVDVAQDVVVKPADPQLRHSLAVCDLGNDQFAFIRPQKRSLKRSLDRLLVDEQNIVFHSDYVPNAMNVLNKVKEAIPKEKFTARHNKITLLDNFSRDELVDVVSSALKQRQLALLNDKIYK
nr:bro-d [Mamestra configurata nucleopolyhedrovirus A]WRQ96800.1 bro-c [Mamestra configurata nucleopolyhedrovirus B]WRQ96963.1 bro-c [Mamestra configurata nucleopolyhedrovirus B]